jgi:hypothetical protein
VSVAPTTQVEILRRALDDNPTITSSEKLVLISVD